jgi:ATP-dependent DNA helicase PIF1
MHIHAVNPEPGRATAPAAIRAIHADSESLNNDLADLSDIINRVQHHTCSEAYCIRKKTADGQMACRFYVLRQERDIAEVSKAHNPIHWSFIAACNDSQLNHYNPLLSIAWRVNTDITPCTTKDAVLNYIAKYYSKAETKTLAYDQLMKEVLPRLNTNAPYLSFIAKTMNLLITERDWSAQEVSHLLLGLRLQEGSRTVVQLDCRPTVQTEEVVEIDPGIVDDISTIRKQQSP